MIKESNCAINEKIRLVELVDTSDLKSDSIIEYRFKSDNE
jgi:hypothetical protein